MPSTRSPSSLTARRYATRSSGGHTPTRCMPVSTFTWTSTGPRAAAANRARPSREYSDGVNRWASATASASGGNSDSTRIGASTPAARSSSPSSTSATPHQVAPASNAARATAMAP